MLDNVLRNNLASIYRQGMSPVHQDLVPVPGETHGGRQDLYDDSYRLPDKPLPYSCTDEEAMLLQYAIRENNLRHGFEIATAFGFSSLAMGNALRANGGRLVSMDCYIEEQEETLYYKPALVEEATNRLLERMANDGTVPRGLAFARQHAEALGLADTITYVVGASPNNVAQHVNPADKENLPLDLVFVDGGHFGDQPLLDFLAVAPFLSPDRCAVFFHDFADNPADSVARAVAEAERQLGTKAVRLKTRWNLTLIGRGLSPEVTEKLRQLPWRSEVAAKEETIQAPTVITQRSAATGTTVAPEQISVVVQGAVAGAKSTDPARQLTRICLESIRQSLPGAEIILSTWAGSDVRGLSFDTLLENEDPGGVCYHTVGEDGVVLLNNVNRQITSTRNGLMAATRPYALKIRTDFALNGSDFLQYFGRFQERADTWKLVKERVLSCTVYARNPRRKFPFLFHPSDWIFFGHHEDLLGMWNIPLAPEPENSRWFETRPRPKPDYFPVALNRYTPEQWIWLNFLRKHGDVPLEHQWTISPDMLALSELTIANNLVLLEPWQWQIHTNKPRLAPVDGETIYTYGDWLRLYRQYCAPNFPVEPDWTRLARTARYHISEGRAAIRKRIFAR